ncbi:MAG: hypothetical protein RL007_2614 [Bacteroidota bacterium]|jgi:hypothetical protein
MKKYYLLACIGISALVFTSCGDDKNDNKSDSVKTVQSDPFRESVMKLRRNGFLKKYNEKQLDSLIDWYKKDQMNGMADLMIASGDLMHIDLSLEGRAPHEMYPIINDSIGNRYPDLKASEIKSRYITEKKADKTLDTMWIVTSQKFGNAVYERQLYCFSDWPVDEFYYRIYNTMMADSAMDTRLYLVNFYCDTCRAFGDDDFLGNLDYERMGLIRLTKQQADTLLTITQLMLEPEKEFDIYSTKKVDDELNKLSKSGIFGQGTEKLFDRVVEDVKQTSIYRQEQILDFADTFFCHISLDTLNDYNPFEDAINALAEASRGNFKPRFVSDERIGNTNIHHVSFTFNGVNYDKEMELQNGLVSPYIVDFVNQALMEQGVKGAFYTVSTSDNVMIAVYIADEISEQAKGCGFFPIFDKGGAMELKIVFDQAGVQ